MYFITGNRRQSTRASVIASVSTSVGVAPNNGGSSAGTEREPQPPQPNPIPQPNPNPPAAAADGNNNESTSSPTIHITPRMQSQLSRENDVHHQNLMVFNNMITCMSTYMREHEAERLNENEQISATANSAERYKHRISILIDIHLC